MSHTCDFVNNNGYSVCINCGITEIGNNHYWCKDQSNEVYKRNELKELGKSKDFKKDWEYLLKINTIFTKDKSHYVNSEILYILNQLPLAPKIKKNLYEHIKNKEFKSYKEVWSIFYKIICNMDLPITTNEYIEILNAERKRKNTFNPLTKKNMDMMLIKEVGMVKVRKYYWYITKSIEKARKILGFSYEEGHELYKIVFNYYNLIRFGMYKSSNPILLIQNLVYYTIRYKFKPNQQFFNKKNFGLQSFCYITQLVKYLKEIKEGNFDSRFSEKLTINPRNMKLYNTIY